MVPFQGKDFSFHSNSADDSFVGTFEGVTEATLCLTEHAAVGFIRTSRPDLYQKLNGLPVASFKTPEDFNNCQQLYALKRKFFEDKENIAPADQVQAVPSGLGLKDRVSSATSNAWNSSQQRLLETQHKRCIQRQLLSRRSISVSNQELTCCRWVLSPAAEGYKTRVVSLFASSLLQQTPWSPVQPLLHFPDSKICIWSYRGGE